MILVCKLHFRLRKAAPCAAIALCFLIPCKWGSDVLSWAHWLMMSTFDEIAQREVPRHISFEILHLCQAWVREHVGSKLKSLNSFSPVACSSGASHRPRATC